MKTILITNDDGYYSEGIRVLHDSVKELGEALIVAPEGPQSGASMSLTFHKPLRINRVVVGNTLAYTVSGSPADAVMLGIHSILKRRPDIVVSGINYGDNCTFQDVFASGTVAGAIEGAINRIPSIAFSMVVPETAIFSPGSMDLSFERTSPVAKSITSWVLDRGLPHGVDLLNVNFPLQVDEMTSVLVTKLARRKYSDYAIERKDPRGRPYFWIWGKRFSKFEKWTDAYAIHFAKAISITPISLNLTADIDQRRLDDLTEKVKESLRKGH
ncbi:MAG: 5'/3'-nucleotidase SurE [Nitrososphaeria archaeon]